MLLLRRSLEPFLLFYCTISAGRVKTEICCVPDLVWRALCEIKRWICHIVCVDGVL